MSQHMLGAGADMKKSRQSFRSWIIYRWLLGHLRPYRLSMTVIIAAPLCSGPIHGTTLPSAPGEYIYTLARARFYAVLGMAGNSILPMVNRSSIHTSAW
jgi:hypothetical protein